MGVWCFFWAFCFGSGEAEREMLLTIWEIRSVRRITEIEETIQDSMTWNSKDMVSKRWYCIGPWEWFICSRLCRNASANSNSLHRYMFCWWIYYTWASIFEKLQDIWLASSPWYWFRIMVYIATPADWLMRLERFCHSRGVRLSA